MFCFKDAFEMEQSKKARTTGATLQVRLMQRLDAALLAAALPAVAAAAASAAEDGDALAGVAAAADTAPLDSCLPHGWQGVHDLPQPSLAASSLLDPPSPLHHSRAFAHACSKRAWRLWRQP